MPPRSRRTWKKSEQAFAEALDTHRIPLLGRHGSDFETPLLRIEHKNRPAPPAYITEAWFQLDQVSSPKIPAVGLSYSRQGVKAQRYLMFRLEDFVSLLERLGGVEATGFDAQDAVPGGKGVLHGQ